MKPKRWAVLRAIASAQYAIRTSKGKAQMVINGELHTLTISLVDTHLSHALDLFRRSNKLLRDSKTVYNITLAQRCALSSIIHGFCALESMANYIGFEMFFNSDSKRYITPDKRDLLLERFVKSWDKTNAIEKIEFIVHYSGSKALPASLISRLRELNTLRNWLVHGFPYTTTLLLDPINEADKSAYNVVDREDSVDWKSKFPNTKFKPLGELDFNDAQTALIIVLEILKVISECTQQPIGLFTCEYERGYKILWGDTFDIHKLLQFQDDSMGNNIASEATC